MKKTDHRLKKNSQFNFIYKKGEKVHTDNFTLFIVKSKYPSYKIGFVVGKKLGKANKRNKLKRRMREIVRNLNIPSFCNYILLARDKAAELDFVSIKNELTKIFEKYEKKKSV